jgi:hypothetical protein
MTSVCQKSENRIISSSEILYRRKLQSARNGALESWLGATSPEEVCKLAPPPGRTPEKIWKELSASAKCKSILSRWDKRIASGALSDALSEDDFLNMSFPASSARSVAVLRSLLNLSFINQSNPTLEELGAYVVRQVDAEKPLRIVMSQCFKKTPEVREQKLAFYLGQDSSVETPKTFIQGVETLGWDTLASMVRNIPWPLEISIVLGDMDWFSMDGCKYWANKSALEGLEKETVNAQKALQREASAAFPEISVKVKRWTDLYSLSEFEQELSRAKDTSHWIEEGLIEDSLKMYLDQWGYRAKGRKMGVAEEALLKFIEGDCIRTGAQYRVEANKIQSLDAIQAWAERVPNPLWPLRMSNYDGAGVPPTIFLLPNGKE